MLRFVKKSAAEARRRSLALTTEEISQAEKIALKRAQAESFLQDIEALRDGRPLPQRSQLHTLCPALGEDGLLRVGGRLRKAPVSEETRHQIILDPAHEIARLVITHYHLSLRCAGIAHVHSELRQQFWILRGQRAVRKVSVSCRLCHRMRVGKQASTMADLPEACKTRVYAATIYKHRC